MLSFWRAHAQLDTPTLALLEGAHRLGLEQQRPDLRHLRPKAHRHDIALLTAVGGKRHLHRRQLVELAREIEVLEGKLANTGFVERAPADVVEKARRDLERLRTERGALA